MNDSDYREIKSLLLEKKTTLEKVLSISRERSFKAVEEDVERFENFYNKREVYFNNVIRIDNNLKKYIINSKDKSNPLYKEVERITDETKKVAKQIIEIDEKNHAVMEELMEYIKKNLRNIKSQQQVKLSYQDYFSSEFTSSRFDTKQ